MLVLKVVNNGGPRRGVPQGRSQEGRRAQIDLGQRRLILPRRDRGQALDRAFGMPSGVTARSPTFARLQWRESEETRGRRCSHSSRRSKVPVLVMK